MRLFIKMFFIKKGQLSESSIKIIIILVIILLGLAAVGLKLKDFRSLIFG